MASTSAKWRARFTSLAFARTDPCAPTNSKDSYVRKRLGGRRRCQALWLRMSCNSLVCGSSPSPHACRSPSPVYEAVILPNGQPPERGSVAASAPLVRAAAALPRRRSPYTPSHSRSWCDSPLGRQPPPPQPTHPGGRINLDTVTCYKVRQRFALFECSRNRQIRTDFMMGTCACGRWQCLEKGHFANHCPNRAVTRRPPLPSQ